MKIEKLLDGLMVEVEPFVICRTGADSKLELPAAEFPTLHYVIAGSGTIHMHQKPDIPLSAGDMIIQPGGIAQQLSGSDNDDENLPVAQKCLPLSLGMQEKGSYIDEGGIVMACSSVRASYQKVHGLFDYLHEPIMAHTNDSDDISQVVTLLLKEMADPKPGSHAMISLLMTQCLVFVLRQYCGSGNCQVPWLSALDDPQLSKSLEQMIDEPGRRFSLELLAEIAGMSRSSFSQRFKDAFGRSAMDFLKELRLQKAAELLRNTQRPIKSIADQVGFESRSHFSQSFTGYFGQSPAEFREKQTE